MSDAHLRDLERRWKETGSSEDEAAYLRARVRVGDLERRMLELAAWLGHAPARTVWTEHVPGELGKLERIDTLMPLERYGREAILRAFLALAHETLQAWLPPDHDTHAAENKVRALTCLAATEAGLASGLGSAASEQAARRALEIVPSVPADPADPLPDRYSVTVLDAVHRLPAVLLIENDRQAANTVWVALGPLTLYLEEDGRDVIRRELIPWALGYGDPVWSRVTKRGLIDLPLEGA